MDESWAACQAEIKIMAKNPLLKMIRIFHGKTEKNFLISFLFHSICIFMKLITAINF